MAWICVAQPAVEPVSVDEAKLHCRIDVDEDDGLVAALITTAREYLEAQARPRLAILTQSWRYVADAWPESDTLELRPYPLQSVTAVSYTGPAGVTRTMDAADYLVDTASEPGRLRLRSNASWPGDELQELNGLAVDFVAGFGDNGGDAPAALRQAILMLVAHWYENRELALTSGAVPKEVPFAVNALVGRWRREV